ncbi:MAG: ABC transporter ATP-binding protein [Elusimicrobiota bacterium]|nr:ABC transporter ATP-binding protein [Elusimicrobiota bacterium]
MNNQFSIEESMNIVELKNVTKIYKRGVEDIYALNDINLSVSKGEFLSIVGPSGSGKTTLLNIIGCMDIPTKGKVFIDSKDVSNANEKILTKIRRETVGFVFQQFFLIPTLTVLENVQLPTLFIRNKKNIKDAKKILKLVGLEKRLYHLPSQLSGGEMQRVAIARALINSPKILLADEPTGNLDTKNAENIMEIFNELNNNGLTIIMVTHNIELAKRTKRCIRLEDGILKI